MYRQRRVSIVIPAYNVASQLEAVVRGVPALVDRIIVVNDAATDATAEVLDRIRDPRLLVIHHFVNQGVGGAMVTGFRAALEGEADFVVKMDGDGQMDPKHLPELLDPLVGEEYAYAKGNRFLDGAALQRMPKARLAANFALTFLTKMVSGYWNLFDPQNGFLAIRAEVLRKLPLDSLASRYFFENDMLVHLNVADARVKDVAIPARYGEERSSVRLRDVAVFPFYFFRRFWYRIYQKYVLRDFSPIAVFWLAGAVLLTWGAAFGAYTWLKSSWSGRVASTGTVMLSALPLILGFQLSLQAILTEIQETKR
jgi:glycosyltransferase involved in cell wall biosynthesis